MERDANYLAVGAFTLLVLAMGLAFVLWYSDSGDTRSYNNYEIYFSGSVAGLTPGSPVRYLGVDVGSVRRITLNKERPDSVKIVAAVDSNAPISGTTRASLGLQGITGLLYINLKQINDASTATTELKTGERYPVIESQSSDIDAFLATLPQLAVRVTNLVDNVNRVFSDDNVQALTATLANLKKTTDGLPQTREQLQRLLADLAGTATQARELSTALNNLAQHAAPDMQQAIGNLNQVSSRLASTSTKLDEFMANSKAPLDHFTQHSLYDMEQLLRDARTAANEFRELSRSLKQNPSQLMFERQESGVEIAK